jgi:type IV pilus assembly protein PilY1
VFRRKVIPAMIAACGLAASVPGPGIAEVADLADVPLANAPDTAVLPNLMYILDDSGSMMWDYMPDYIHSGPGAGSGTKEHCKTLTNCSSAGCTVNIAGTACSQGTSPSDWGEAPYYSPRFNQIYYNPDIAYDPAVNSVGTSLGNINPAMAWKDFYLDQSTANAITLQNQYPDIYYCVTSAPNASALATTTMCVRNGRDNIAASPNDYFLYWSNSIAAGGPRGGYPSGSSTGNAFQHRVVQNTGNPYYFKIAAHEYCSDENLTVCQLATSAGASPGGAFTIPAPVRFCSLKADAASTTVVSGTHQTTSTASTPAGSSAVTVATVAGYEVGQAITITLDDGTIFTTTISSVTTSSSRLGLAATIPTGRFIPNGGAVAGAAKCQKNFRVGTHEFARYGRFTRTDITSSTATYAKSATAVRPDCGSGPTCTYEQELQNFANWYSYYRIRMSLMKTATGRAFRTIDDRYRVGFITINPASSGSGSMLTKAISPSDVRYLPIGTFNAAQKLDFYETLYSQDNHGGTPLRVALSRVGRHFAGETDGINNGMDTDPVQFSCQQNFALLTSDGYWNDGSGSAVATNSSEVGNQDGLTTAGTPKYVSRASGTLDGSDAGTMTQTPNVEKEQVVCTGSGNITGWTTGGTTGSNTTACGCTGSQKAIWERTRTQTVNVTSVNGVPTNTTTVVNTVSFTLIQPCDVQTQTKEMIVHEVQYDLCSTTGQSTSFSIIHPDGTASGQAGLQTACGCGPIGGGRKYRVWKRERDLLQTDTLVNGVVTNTTVTSIMPNTTTFSSLHSTCTSNVPSVPANSLTTGAPTTTASAGLRVTTGMITLATNPITAPNGPVSTTDGEGGTSNTLADVAMYYYKTDLRQSGPVSTNNVPTSDKDIASHQHMVTFTLGLGLTGLMNYRADYESAVTGDFANIKAANTNCSWSTTPGQVCNWPVVQPSSPTTLDDLWHAAVNGRGTFYSAADPNSLAEGLAGALTALKIQTAAASASATSSPNITETDNFIYSSTFRTVKWDGQITAQRIDTATGNVLPAIVWEAQAQLDGKVDATTDTRKIFKLDPSNSSSINTSLKQFLWANLTPSSATADACSIAKEQACFNFKGANLSQYAAVLTSAQKAFADDGQNLVNWLRGQTRFEGALDPADQTFRDREHVLGDAVNATPAYVRAPVFNFEDAVTPRYKDGAGNFRDANAGRLGVLYIAANDGSLHAFNGETGDELWAYVPRMVFPELNRLGTESWDQTHRYSVDGSPQVMDVFQAENSSGSTTGAWKTMLVGGLNKGGRGFYALDVTDPNNPKGMWEICSDANLCAVNDPDLGFSFGNAVITKRAADGKWVVLVTSGINNVSPGTGEGYLYVLDAFTGAILRKVATGDGDTTTPSGLSKISAFADNFAINNTATFIYGGDLKGNVWRFDMSVDPPAVLRLAELKDAAGGKPQSITSRPELGVVDNKRVVFIGTGRYLGEDDLKDPATLVPALAWAYQQSFYAIKDPFDTTVTGDNGHGDVRAVTPNGLVEQTLTDNGTTRTISNNTVPTTALGWVVDFNPGNTSPGERVNLDPQLVLGTVVVVTNVPNNNACTVGGDSFIYQFNYQTGSNIASAPGGTVATKFTGQITVGLVVVRLPSGVFKGVATGATGTKTPVGVNVGGAGGTGRRVSWRELLK